MIKYKFVISSLNTEKLINNLIQKYSIFNIEKNEINTSFYCLKNDRKKIQKILKRSGYKTSSEEYKGIFKYIKNIFSFGIIFGLFFSFIFYLISSFFITDVLIWGNISFCGQDVLMVLKNNNINKWSLKSNVNIQKLENDIMNIKYVSYVSAIIKGNALVINIKEQLTNTEVVNIGEYLPIVSVYDCKITSIKLIQGTAKVKVGDIVHTGQILVEPYTLDTTNNKLSVQPLAEICGDVWLTSNVDFYDTKIVKNRTGNVVKNFCISLCGITVYKKESNVEFKDYEIEESENFLSYSLLPIKIKRQSYYECNITSVNIDFESSKQQFIEQTRKTCLLNLNNYDIIKNESYVISDYSGYHTISYTITANRKIV